MSADLYTLDDLVYIYRSRLVYVGLIPNKLQCPMFKLMQKHTVQWCDSVVYF